MTRPVLGHLCRRCRKYERRPGGLICFNCWANAQRQRAEQPRYYRKVATSEEIRAMLEEPVSGIMAAERLITRWQRGEG